MFMPFWDFWTTFGPVWDTCLPSCRLLAQEAQKGMQIPKSSPRGPREVNRALRVPPESHRETQESRTEPQDRPKRAQASPKGAQQRPKGDQDRPRESEENPREPKEITKSQRQQRASVDECQHPVKITKHDTIGPPKDIIIVASTTVGNCIGFV